MKKKRFSFIFMFSIIVLIVFTFNVTSSRYIGEIESDAKDVIAVPIIDITNPTLEYTPNSIIPGIVDELDFYVNNYDDTNTNEVLMKYYIKMEISKEIPVKITLTDGDGVEIPLDSEGKTPEKDLIYSTKMQDKYHIKLEWNEKDNSYKYAGKNIKIIIDLVATQVVEGV